jgi:glucose/arabinose dehydrogenase
MTRVARGVCAASLTALACAPAAARPIPPQAGPPDTATKPLVFSDYRGQSPGTKHLIRPADLPPPDVRHSVENSPRLVARPAGARPKVPPGFKVELYASGLVNPRLLRTAPNGDVFVAESRPGVIKVLRGVGADGKVATVRTYARGLDRPFGIAFHPPAGEPRWLYVANTDAVVRFPYKSGDLEAGGKPATVVELPGGGLLRGGGHWTRDVAFSSDGRKMFVSVGSRSNIDDPDETPAEKYRACILEFGAEGGNMRVYASGIRNPVGLAVQPRTGTLWTSVNERDELGDNLVPDYITSVREGGFYGWPWFYIGGNADPRLGGKRRELRDKTIVPDVLVQAHNASLQLAFYEGAMFPPAYRGDLFAAQHGSWNREVRTGYEVIRVPMQGRDRPSGGYEDFMTGFVTEAGDVWGRPVGVAVATDGALLVSDDGGNVIWRVTASAP